MNSKHKLIPLDAILTDSDKRDFSLNKQEGEYVYVKDDEGYVTMKLKSEMLPNEVIITKSCNKKCFLCYILLNKIKMQ